MEQQPTAAPVWISELLSASFLQQEETPSAVALKDGRILQRIRLYGIAVSTDELVVDDGTGSILVRTFDKTWLAKIGDPVLVIGRPRVYNQLPYLLGEIVKKTDSKWLELRKKQQPSSKEQQTGLALATVRALDTGDGADYNEVVERLGSRGEEFIVHLLAIGALFETRPGKLKVLE